MAFYAQHNQAPKAKIEAPRKQASNAEPSELKNIRTPAELLKQYQGMEEDVMKTRLGKYDTKGKILSGVVDGAGLSPAVQLLLMLGFNVRLKEVEKKLRVDRVKVSSKTLL